MGPLPWAGILLTADQAVEDLSDLVGGAAHDGHPVVVEERLLALGEEEVEGRVAGRQLFQANAVHRLVELVIEVEDPELIEVAQDNIFGAVRDQVQPVFKGLAVMLLELFAALLHLQEEAGAPEEVGELGAFALVDAVFQLAAGFDNPRVSESLE